MKKILLFFLAIILILVFIAKNNASQARIVSGLLKKGEIKMGDLRYRIDLFGVIPVGEAVIALEREVDYNGKKALHLNATAQTLKFYSGFFKGYAVLDSYVDKDSFVPFLFKQKVEAPGKENPYKEVFYDQKNGTMSLAGVVRTIFPNTQDPLSAVFNLRRTDFDKNKDIQMYINTNQKNYVMTGSSKRRNLSINRRSYKIMMLNAEIKRSDKDSYHKSRVSMALLEEKGNIPILIRVFASGVLINVRLEDIN